MGEALISGRLRALGSELVRSAWPMLKFVCPELRELVEMVDERVVQRIQQGEYVVTGEGEG